MNGDATTTYRYDALGRRIQEGPTTLSGQSSGQEPYTELYYSANWRVIMEVQQTWVTGGGSGVGDEQLESSGMFVGRAIHCIWSERYIDALVLRDRDTNFDGNLNERLYVQQRFVYDPYGVATVLDASWEPTSAAHDWRYLHQGGRFEANSQLYHFRNREFDPVLGRWVQQDPLSYIEGPNLKRQERQGRQGKRIESLFLAHPGALGAWRFNSFRRACCLAAGRTGGTPMPREGIAIGNPPALSLLWRVV